MMGGESSVFEVLGIERTGPASSSSFGERAQDFPNLLATPQPSKLYCQ